MPIDKSVNPAPLTVEIEQEEMPDIEIYLEEDGSAIVEIGDDEEVGFYDNLALIIDESDLSHISIELMSCSRRISRGALIGSKCTQKVLTSWG